MERMQRMSKAFRAYEVNVSSDFSDNRAEIIDRAKHMVMHSAASFSDVRAGILKEIREENGRLRFSDIVNACGLSYAKLHFEIERRYERNIGQTQRLKAKNTLER